MNTKKLLKKKKIRKSNKMIRMTKKSKMMKIKILPQAVTTKVTKVWLLNHFWVKLKPLRRHSIPWLKDKIYLQLKI